MGRVDEHAESVHFANELDTVLGQPNPVAGFEAAFYTIGVRNFEPEFGRYAFSAIAPLAGTRIFTSPSLEPGTPA